MPESPTNDRRRADRKFIGDLSAFVAASDPLGLIGSGMPDDEYDCMLGSIVAGLRGGLPAEELATEVRARFLEHFAAAPPETFAAALISWHQTRGSNSATTEYLPT